MTVGPGQVYLVRMGRRREDPLLILGRHPGANDKWSAVNLTNGERTYVYDIELDGSCYDEEYQVAAELFQRGDSYTLFGS